MIRQLCFVMGFIQDDTKGISAVEMILILELYVNRQYQIMMI